MFELKFGIIWESFVTFVTVCFLLPTIFEGGDAVGEFIPAFLFLLIFHAVGIAIFVKGVMKVKTDKNTDKYGIEVFGKVTEIHPNGNTMNGRRELEATISAFIPNEGQSREFQEVVGLGTSPYEEGDYIRGKYYNDDINITEKVYPDYLPANIRTVLGTIPTKRNNEFPQQEIIYESADIIQVDGVRYQRIK